MDSYQVISLKQRQLGLFYYHARMDYNFTLMPYRLFHFYVSHYVLSFFWKEHSQLYIEFLKAVAPIFFREQLILPKHMVERFEIPSELVDVHSRYLHFSWLLKEACFPIQSYGSLVVDSKLSFPGSLDIVEYHQPLQLQAAANMHSEHTNFTLSNNGNFDHFFN